MIPSAGIRQAPSATSPLVTVIYSHDRASSLHASRGATRILHAIVGASHLLVAATLFYAVWWPIDAWMAVSLMMKVPLPMEAIRQMSGEAKPSAQHGLVWLLSVDLEEHPTAGSGGAEGGTHGTRLLYPAQERGEIAGQAAYYWQALMATGVWIWSMAAGKRLGGVVGRRFRRLGGWCGVLVLLGLVAWAAITWKRMGYGFPVSAGQVGVGGISVCFLLAGVAHGFRGRVLESIAATWLLLLALATVVALTVADRCDLLEAHLATLAFRLKVFALLSSYAWVALLLIVFSRRRTHNLARA